MTKVYVVIGGWDYEGQDVDSVRLFLDRESAEWYGKELTVPDPTYERTFYDYVEIVERTIGD